MADSILSQEFVFNAIEAEKSGTQFPIDFDEVWKGLGYSRKYNAKRALKSKLIENIDFLIKEERSTTVLSGYVNENIQLTIEGFKMLCMMAETPEGREVRMYFIEIEKSYLAQLQRQLDA